MFDGFTRFVAAAVAWFLEKKGQHKFILAFEICPDLQQKFRHF